MKKILAILILSLFCFSPSFADTLRLESSDDGYLVKDGSSYSVNDYILESGIQSLKISLNTAGTYERRAYKRFILDLGASVTVQSATLYWYFVNYDDDNGSANCKLEQISDYGTLVASSTDWDLAATHEYGNVMTPETSTGWISQDVTTEVEASKEDAYIAFRWVNTAPTSEEPIYYIGAYENSTYKAYLVISTSTGWSHNRDGVANASIGKIDGVAKASIDKVDGVD